MDISEWIAAGRPLVTSLEGMGWNTTSVQRPPKGKWGVSCYCSPATEQKFSAADRASWYSACPTCKAQQAVVAGLEYSEKTQAFVAPGTRIADQKMIVPVQPVSPPTAAPGRAIDTRMKTAPTPVQPIGAPMKTSYASLGSLAGTVVPGVGTVGGGVVGGVLDLLGGIGKSKCPGPYNYVNGQCVPKSGFAPGGTTGGTTGPTCPEGTTYDASTGQCKVGGVTGAIQRGLPGGATGYVDPLGWASTQGIGGVQGFIPQSVPSSYLVCPKGYVLYGKQPGMEVCLPKGMLPNKLRKWPKAPRPAMTAQDVKTLNRINAIQRKVSNMAVKAGYKKPSKR